MSSTTRTWFSVRTMLPKLVGRCFKASPSGSSITLLKVRPLAQAL